MKSILISIKPKYVANILNKEKTIEIRKTMPKCELPIDVYIYCTKEDDLFKSYIRMGYFTTRSTADDIEYNGKGKVVAKFTLNKMIEIEHFEKRDETIYVYKNITQNDARNSCIAFSELNDYLKGKKGYGWVIDDLEIFDRPKELSEFCGIKQYFVGCESGIDKTPRYAQLTKAPQSYCFIEIGE